MIRKQRNRSIEVLAAALVVAGIAVPASLSAGWRDRHFPGSMCVTRNNNGLPTTTQFMNPTTSAMEVVCPVPYDLDSTQPNSDVQAAYFRMIYSDQNNTAGGAGSLSCGLEIYSEAGGGGYAPSRESCATAGGCTTPQTGYFVGHLTFGITNFDLSNGWINAIYFRCYLPQKAPVGGYQSSLLAYQGYIAYQ